MPLRLFSAAALAAVLAGCAMMPGHDAAPPQMTPSACGPRDITVYFEGQSVELSPDARAVIDAAGAGLAGCRITHVKVIGSSDAIGAETTNEVVSKQRAKVLGDYVVDTFHWPRETLELLATGERGAVTDQGLAVPMRDRARIVVDATAP